MRLQNWKELLAAAGVIISLLFVGFEINQNTRVARAEARAQLSSENAQWLTLLGTNTEVRQLWDRVWDSRGLEHENLSQDEKAQFRYLLVGFVRRLENVYFQYEEGLVDESALESYGFQATRDRFRIEFFRSYWNNMRSGYDPGFVAFLDRRILSDTET